MESTIIFNPIYLESNQGHGNARRLSLKNCSNELVALMDADDISLPSRFAQQIRRFEKKPGLDIVGGQITEFDGSPENITGVRSVPLRDSEIKHYMKKRCPMNQVSVMFRKQSVEKAGGYWDWFCEEDYYLWIRMAEQGCTFENIPNTLVNVRVGEEMSARRGGRKYFLSEAKLQKYMFDRGIINFPRYLYNIVIRFGGEILLPTSLRSRAYRVMRRKYTPQMRKTRKADTIKQAETIKKKYPKFSVSMCVYGGDNAEWFDMALESVVNQTVPPNEIVLVVDGPIPEDIMDVIKKYENICRRGIDS